MLRFAFAQFVVLLAIPLLNHRAYRGTFVRYVDGNLHYFSDTAWPLLASDLVQLCLLPAALALLLANIAHFRRPRRLFGGHAGGARMFAAGVAAGALTIVLALPLSLLTLDNLVPAKFVAPDWLVFPVASLFANSLVLAFCRSTRPGLCPKCAYDLRASLDAGRCPECGLGMAALMAG